MGKNGKKWLEVLGCGMVRNVLRNVGIDRSL